jgi:hypothetical protein
MLRWLFALVLLASCRGDVGAPPSPAASLSPQSGAPARTSEARLTPTPDPATLARCDAAALQAVVAWAPTTDGSLVGAIFIANRGGGPCTLRGNPELGLRGADGRAIDVRVAMVTGVGGPPAPVVVPVTQFREDPAGLVGAGASAPLEWENYCATEKVLGLTVVLPEGAGRIDGAFVEPSGVAMRESLTPRCEDAAGSSTLAVHPLQEPRR